jgi:hypothetical protein
MAPRLPGFGVLHSVLRDETAVFHTPSASEQGPTRQYSDRRALNGTVIGTEGEDLKPRLTGDDLAATQGSAPFAEAPRPSASCL